MLKNRPAGDERRPRRFDPEDGLPYPAVLMDRIQQSIVAQAREGSALAVEGALPRTKTNAAAATATEMEATSTVLAVSPNFIESLRPIRRDLATS